MSGWIAAVALAALTLLALWRLGGFRGAALQLLGAALLVGLAGYAWQGRPGLEGQPVEARIQAERPETAFAALRGEFLPQFDSARAWLILADRYQRTGQSGEAVKAIRAGLRTSPRNLTLWIALGNALTIHGQGMNEAAELAYRRAAAIAPGHPAPLFFYGMNLVESGRIEEGGEVWRDVLAKAPADASWRPLVAERVALVEQLQAMRR